MAKIIGDTGAEKTLIQELQKSGIRSLRSLNEVENHLNGADIGMERLTEAARTRIRKEIESMNSQHSELVEEKEQKRMKRIELLTSQRDTLKMKLEKPQDGTRNPFMLVIQKFRRWRDQRRLRVLDERFDEEVGCELSWEAKAGVVL